VDQLEIPSWADNTSAWKALHERIAAGPPAAEGFLHRDYHPGNILWHNGRISGIVDWVNGCIDPWKSTCLIAVRTLRYSTELRVLKRLTGVIAI
jgi:aminoglycoside/choline kinase family phosphotransferase